MSQSMVCRAIKVLRRVGYVETQRISRDKTVYKLNRFVPRSVAGIPVENHQADVFATPEMRAA